MTLESLKYLNDQLSSIINYSLIEWAQEVVYPYWVGEYNEVEMVDEDGMQETTFILTGTTKGTWTDLENDKRKIKELFKNQTAILPNGNGIAIFYQNSLLVPVEDMDLKRIQINLEIKEWEVI